MAKSKFVIAQARRRDSLNLGSWFDVPEIRFPVEHAAKFLESNKFNKVFEYRVVPIVRRVAK